MPFLYQTLAFHDDGTHVGNAKRNVPGGVAPIDAARQVPIANLLYVIALG